jgi:putative ABC transport system permease protein
MLKSYFKTAFRNLKRHWAFFFINVVGLAIGMTACFLIFLYVIFELSYDDFNKKANRIYRIASELTTSSGTNNNYYTSGPMALNMKIDFPEVQSMVRFQPNSILIRKGDVKFQEEQTLFADSSLFSIFDFHLLNGNAHTALREPFSIVLSKTAAKKYFGFSNPVGQIVEMTGWRVPAKVTGIMEDIPENSQIKADMFVSMTTISQNWNTEMDKNWRDFNCISYVLLKPGAKAEILQGKLSAFLQRHYGQEMKANQLYYKLFLEPLKKVYLHSRFSGMVTGNMNYVYIFSVIALFILLIGSINFINLTTARATERAREVGIRKLIGASRKELAKQFLGESLLHCLAAFFFSIIVSYFLLPLFNQLAGKTISRGIFTNTQNIPALLLLAVLIGIAAGIYPAVILSSYRPVLVLKGRFASGGKGVFLRRLLVITQFTISIILISGTIVVYRQLHYMRSKDLGFNKDQTMIITTNGDPAAPAFKEQISSLIKVSSTTFSNRIPGGDYDISLTEVENKSGEMQSMVIGSLIGDFAFTNQYQLKLLAGRGFSKDFETDSAKSIILNETAVKSFGYSSPEQAIGKTFVQWGDTGKIIGVVKDFNFNSLQYGVNPMSIRVSNHLQSYISIKINTANLQNTIASIKANWDKLIPNRPFQYFFLDEFFDRQYRDETRFGKLFVNFAILAILISCLGLLGLASYVTFQRTREISIRKVLGASISGLVSLLTKDFFKLVFIALLISIPIGWWTMNKWLQPFAYRIDIRWEIFGFAGLIAISVALITVSFQAIKAAATNPVKNLRTE